MIRLAYLTPSKSFRTDEERSVWDWIVNESKIASKHIVFDDIQNSGQTLSDVDVLWWHYDEAVVLHDAARGKDVEKAIVDFVRGGGSLFLTLLASSYVSELQLESVPPNNIRKGAWDQESWIKDYPDIRGFGSNQGHPIFANLAGAVFTWNPSKDTPYAGAFYAAPAGPKEGKVVAVERQYIKLNEDWRVITEYEAGRGRILAIGAGMFFSNPRDRFRLHLEKFTRNCLTYLANPDLSNIPRTYWEFGQRTVAPAHHASPMVPASLSQSLGSERTDLSMIREPEELKDGFFDVGGRRILVMGREESGVREVWSHPFRMLHNLRTGIRLGSHGLQWFDQLKPRITIRPESVTRVYAVGELRIEETIVGSVDEPGGIIHYHIDSNHPLEFLLTASADQRLMWPHSEQATGSLTWGWDAGINAFIVSNEAGNMVSMVGVSRMPDEHLAGQFSTVTLENGSLKGIPTERVEVGMGMRFSITGRTSEFSLVFAGAGGEEAEKTYRDILERPGTVLTRQVGHIRNRFASSTVIESPDRLFNDGFRWALHATDRFLVETPALGASLMAGFGTTERGWDGGQKISGRPGYAWYFGRDACWTAFAMLSYGNFDAVRESLEFLGTYQDLNGKILHEMTSSGHVHYDAADSTPLYIILMGRYLRASGDVAFVNDQFNRLRRAVEFCFATDTDGDHLIENTNVGHGWVEGGKLFPVHTELYIAACWVAALGEASFAARMAGKQSIAAEWESEAIRVRQQIREEFWNSETNFYNFAKYADGTYNIQKTILPAVATYFGCTDPLRDAACLDAYAGAEFTTDWGVRIVGSDNPMFNPQGYHYGSVWPLFTGWAALAEFSSGRPLQGFLHTVSTMMVYPHFAAGYVEEVLNGANFQPAGVCSHQAWSESMVLQPLLEGMLGLRVDAARTRVSLRPWFPPNWERATVRSIRVGSALIHCAMVRTGQKTTYKFTSGHPEAVTVEFQPILPLGTFVEEIHAPDRTTRPGKTIRLYSDSPSIEFEFTGDATVEVLHEPGLGFMPPLPALHPGRESRGLRIISESINGDEYIMRVQGVPGEKYTLELVDPAQRVKHISGGERRGNMITVSIADSKIATVAAQIEDRIP